MKVWDRAWSQLATPGSSVRHASVARHVNDCTKRPGTARIHKMLVRIANREDPDQTASSEAV